MKKIIVMLLMMLVSSSSFAKMGRFTVHFSKVFATHENGQIDYRDKKIVTMNMEGLSVNLLS